MMLMMMTMIFVINIDKEVDSDALLK